MENKLEITEVLAKTILETKDFVKEQAPDVARQMLEFGAYDAKLSIVVAIIFLILGLCLLVYGITHSDDGDFLPFMSGFIGGFMALSSMFAIPCSYSTLKKIELAPKAYLIEKLTKER